MSRDKIRCPLCPRTMDREDYVRHWGLFHDRDLVSQERNVFREPLELQPRPGRRATNLNDDAPLWED